MKKLIFMLTVGVAIVSNADYIYWMVDTPATVQGFSGPASEVTWANAIISLQDSDATTESGLTPTGSGYLDSLTYLEASGLSAIDAYTYATIGSASDYSGKYFLIELFASDGSWIASKSSSAANLAQYIFGDNSMTPMPATAFGQGATFAVPEPTSGLLFLLGGTLLGLKRRRMA